jgi:hypothetical protein
MVHDASPAGKPINFAFVVVGEHDARAARSMGWPVIFVTDFRKALDHPPEEFLPYSRLYAYVVPGPDGAGFAANLLHCLHEAGWQGSCFDVYLPGTGGLADLIQTAGGDPSRALELLGQALDQAVPLGTRRVGATTPEQVHLTDQGAATYYARHHGVDLLHCWAWKKWTVWDRIRWRVDDTGDAVSRMKQTVRRIFADAVDEIKKTQSALEAKENRNGRSERRSPEEAA